MEQAETLSLDLRVHGGYAGDISARPIEASNETDLDRIDTAAEDDRNGRGCGFCREYLRGARCHNDGHLTPHQIGRQRGQSIVLAVRPTIFDRYVAALDVADLAEAAKKSGYVRRIRARSRLSEEPNDRHLLLRLRCERPRYRRAAQQGDELASSQLTEGHVPPLPPETGHCRDGFTSRPRLASPWPRLRFRATR